jgi:hypothetical protein
LLFEVRFGAFLAWSPRGKSELSQASRDVCYSIKADEPGPGPGVRMIEYAVRRLREIDPPVLRGC